MMHITRVWLCLGLSLMGVAARYLPTPELIVDSLVPFSDFSATVDTSRPVRAERSIEGSGAGDSDADYNLTPIVPMMEPLSKYMERLEASPTHTAHEEEGSGAEPIEIGGMLKDIDDPIKDTFAKEPGMHEVLEDLDSKPVGLPREDDNRQGNSLNVLPSDDRPQTRQEQEEEEQLDEGSGVPDTEPYDATNATIIDLDNESTLKLENEGVNVTTAGVTPIDETTEKIDSTTESDEIATTLNELILSAEHSTEIAFTVNIETSSATIVEAADNTPSTIAPQLEVVTTTEQEERVSIPIHVILASTDSPVSSESPTSSSQPEEREETTPVAEVEILDKSEPNVVLTAAKEATVLETGRMDEASGPQAMSTFIIIGALIVAFMSLVIFIVLRNRRKRSNFQDESTTEGDTAKALLSNGKYKQESEEVKNNEISPLVINKFEKSPNFSSQKNLNTTANDKNIEKDNVLKQAIIEDEVEEAKRAMEEEKEECKRAAEELKNDVGDAEKVVVRTHIDLDSIPRKPVIITKNGNTYHSVPNGET